MNKSLYLIFDLDGCLIDSSKVQKAAFFGSYKEIVGCLLYTSPSPRDRG